MLFNVLGQVDLLPLLAMPMSLAEVNKPYLLEFFDNNGLRAAFFNNIYFIALQFSLVERPFANDNTDLGRIVAGRVLKEIVVHFLSNR